jgi:CRP/FNR family transcriptional regulator, cyclic AMP receptor protein
LVLTPAVSTRHLGRLDTVRAVSGPGISSDRVRAIDVFSELSDDELEQVASLAREHRFERGDELIHHDAWPDDMLALEEGEVEVRRDGDVVATLSAGCVVGERGVLRRALRNADVVAVTPVRVLYFHRNKVRSLRDDLPEIDGRLQALADERNG